MTSTQPPKRSDAPLRRLLLRLSASAKVEEDAAVFDVEGFAAVLKRSHVEIVLLHTPALPEEPIGTAHRSVGEFQQRLASALKAAGIEIETVKADENTTGIALTAFPSRPALEYACYRRLCGGLPLLIEDCLQPTGTYDAEAYRLLGIVFDEIAFKAAWWRGAQRLAEVGLLVPAQPTESAWGAVRILQAGGYSFVLLDADADFTPYRLLVLPEEMPPEGALRLKLQRYLREGGRLLAAFENAAAAAQSELPSGSSANASPGESDAAQTCALLPEPHFRLYAQSIGARHKQAALEALKPLLPDPLLRHDAPGTLEAILTEQPTHNRWALHLLHYLPNGFAPDSPVRDDILSLEEVKFSLKTLRPVARVTLRPQHHDELDFWEHQGRVEFVVPRITGHRLVSIEFAS